MSVVSTQRLTKVAQPITGQTGGQIYTFTIPVGASLPLAIPGAAFFVLSANGPFSIQPDGGAQSSFPVGSGWKSDSQVFTGLTITNLSSSSTILTAGPLTIKIWIGYEQFYSPANIGELALPYEGQVFIIGGIVQAITANDGVTLPKLPAVFSTGFFYGFSSTLPGGVNTNNGANVSIGKSPSFQGDLILPGSWVSIVAPAGKLFSLANIYVTGTNGDGVYFSVA